MYRWLRQNAGFATLYAHVPKLSPAMCGDRQVIEHSGAAKIRIGVPVKPAVVVVDEVELFHGR